MSTHHDHHQNNSNIPNADLTIEARNSVSYFLYTVITQHLPNEETIPVENAFVSVNNPSLNIIQYYEKFVFFELSLSMSENFIIIN